MKQKTRLFSIRVKLMIISVGIVLLLGIVLGISNVNIYRSDMIKMGVERAEIAALIAADSVDGDAIAAIQPGDEEGEGYQKNLEILRSVKQTCGVKFLYTLSATNNKVYYGIDTDETENQCPIGEEFDTPYEELADVFAGGTYVQDYIDYTEDGEVITAYVPIKNSAGDVVAVLGSDYNAAGLVQQIDNMRTQINIVASIFILASILILYIVITAIIKSIYLVNKSLYDLVHSEGDLTQAIHVRTGDEMEIMAGNVNNLLKYIRTIMINISENSVNLEKSCVVIADNLSNAGYGISEVSATMEQMSASMQETNASLNQINEGVKGVYGNIQNISGKASEGDDITKEIRIRAQNIYEQALGAQDDARVQSQQIEEAVNSKIERSKAVEEINVLTENILNITSQTNLLALNASIEAARAGEAGRGFAVVAGEIGKLATDSAYAANQIREVSESVISAVEELATEAEHMVKFMENTAMEGYKMLLNTSQEYRKDAEDIHDIMARFSEDSETVEKIVNNIKQTIEDVNSAVDEVTKGVMNVTEVSTSLAASVGEIGEMADSNKGIAEVLSGEVAKFKLS